jgi:glycerophosphoryl diester phosphodiesterase
MAAPPPIFAHLRHLAATGPVVVAHRGASRRAPENTLRAFRAARTAGAAMQEFDVRQTRDGTLVCLHDATLDRTTDAATVLGPGALVAQLDAAELLALDAGRGTGPREPVPTLSAALAAMVPDGLALVEHKAGPAAAYVDLLRATAAMPSCILQSFDWHFVAAVRALAPECATAVLGPNADHAQLDAAALAAALALGAGMVHWAADTITADQVRECHQRGLLVCTYTTDDEVGLRGLAALGVDALCTNDPEFALGLQRQGHLRRR